MAFALTSGEQGYVQAMRGYVDRFRGAVATLAGIVLLQGTRQYVDTPDVDERQMLACVRELAAVWPPESLRQQHRLLLAASEGVVAAALDLRQIREGRGVVTLSKALASVRSAYELLALAARLTPGWDLVDLNGSCASLVSHDRVAHLE